MSDARYTLSRTSNNYFDGHDLHIADRESGAIITVNRKEGMLAVNVKDDDTRQDMPAAARTAAETLGDDGTELIYDRARESYWTWVNMSLAGEHGFSEVFRAGREGGWLAVGGTELVEDDQLTEAPEAGSPWARFLALAFEAVAEIETYRERFHSELIEAAFGGRGTTPERKRIFDCENCGLSTRRPEQTETCPLCGEKKLKAVPFGSGYDEPRMLGIWGRADMLERIGSMTVEEQERELGFALAAADSNDPDTLRWAAVLIESRLGALVVTN